MKKIYTFLFLFSMVVSYGQVEGTWRIAPVAQSLAVGPALGDFSWWSIGDADLEARACFYDDDFIFNVDGTFENKQGEVTWLEAWQGVAEDTCGEPVAPHDGSNAATWTFNEADATVTLTGVGAHLGIPKVINGAEIDNPANAPESITYPVTFSADGMTMTVDINFGPGFWHFVLEKQETTSTIERDLAKFSFYPNPASSELQVQTSHKSDQIVIRDITGKAIFVRTNPSQTENFNVSELNAGFYLIENTSGKEVSVQKLVIR